MEALTKSPSWDTILNVAPRKRWMLEEIKRDLESKREHGVYKDMMLGFIEHLSLTERALPRWRAVKEMIESDEYGFDDLCKAYIIAFKHPRIRH